MCQWKSHYFFPVENFYIVSMGISNTFLQWRNFILCKWELLCQWEFNHNSPNFHNIGESLHCVNENLITFSSGEFLYCVNGNLNTFLQWRNFILCKWELLCQWEFNHNSPNFHNIGESLHCVNENLITFSSGEFLYCVNGNLNTFLQ